MDQTEDIGRLLRRYRRYRRVTQQELSDRSGVSVRAIRDIELGARQQPRHETVRLLADSLELSGGERARLEAAAGQAVTSDQLRLVYESEPVSPPSPIDAMVGRAAEVVTLTKLLRSGAQRLVTITGLTGVGKTRLALAIASALHRTYRFAVLWTSADPLYATTSDGASRGHDQLSTTIRAGLDGLFTYSTADPGALDSVVIDHPTLVVLDGHPSDQLRLDQIPRLLQRCASVRVLATSSYDLGVYGERPFPLTPLLVPEYGPTVDFAELATVPSVRLLVDHARECCPEFSFAPANADAVTGLIRIVDGLPAAMQAIAYWFATYEPDALYAQVQANPFDFLAASPGGDYADHLIERLGQVRRELTGVAATLLSELADREADWSIADAARLTGNAPAHCAQAVRHLLGLGLVRPTTRTGRSRFQVLNLVRVMRFHDDVPTTIDRQVCSESRGMT
jgi:transcriptional regulator with XRE-family HTH domain